jgi:hypothetical protein
MYIYNIRPRDYYKSCVDEETREGLGVQPLLDLLQQLGGWPVLDGQRFDGWEL